jgi:hypothetical protein
VEWISKAWKELPPASIIPKYFLKCCLSNEEDLTQDDILWDDSEQSGEGTHHLHKTKVPVKDHWKKF